jgi:hypothetical protein
MNYELAKQLKDAGFPQTFPDGRWYYDNLKELCQSCEDHGDVHTDQTHGIVPTLEELIEACGEEFGSVSLIVDDSSVKRWECQKWDGSDEYECSTPLEAVARLWLALNKK